MAPAVDYKYKSSVISILVISFLIAYPACGIQAQTSIWSKHEIHLNSTHSYDNPLYEVSDFRAIFTAPSGRTKAVCGFWDGGTDWKIRFMPDETGTWTWRSLCSDKSNNGLHEQSGAFECIENSHYEILYQKGAIQHEPGTYYLSHADGTPFFWLACTAWNGALKSTNEEWEHYLDQRKANNYNTIQFVCTEWRGCDKNLEGLTAIEGTGYIRIHPEFFKRIDRRIDEINNKGLLASPVVLWALPFGQGRHLSPGYTLPLEEAVLLAKYIVARYQANHVVWTLGGDGQYYGDQEIKWKEIGRRIFNDIDHAPVTLHPHGRSFVGELYAQEDWYNLMGYQSSHSNAKGTVDWINKGEISESWKKLKAMPYINMEPNYEEIRFLISAEDVRNASYWSLFATPIAGITYGANGIWPWLQPGELILNHNDKGGVTGWRKSIDFPGSLQMGYLAGFIQKFDWWNLYPANDILAKQPGEDLYNHWISVVKSPDSHTIMAYIPHKSKVKLYNPSGFKYAAQWFDPVTNTLTEATINQAQANSIEFVHDFENDMLMVLKKK
jgi:hypothetical protein